MISPSNDSTTGSTTISTSTTISNGSNPMFSQVKLNGDNCQSYSQAFRVFVGAKRTTGHIDGRLATKDSTYLDWLAITAALLSDFSIALKRKLDMELCYLRLQKKIRDALKEVYGNEKNISRIFE